MAYTFSALSQPPATGPVCMYGIKTTLVSAGWVVKSDSDGTTYAPTGGQVTTGASGVNGLGNQRAWIRLQAPTVGSNQREIIFQRGNSGTSATDDRAWRIKYSANAGFTGGSPSATVTPTATDEVVMAGAGTDASPTFLGSWFNANAGYHWYVAAGGAAEFYSFVAYAAVNATGVGLNSMALDVMATGSFASIDVDPAVMYVSSIAPAVSLTEVTTLVAASGTNAQTSTTNSALARAWLGATSQAGTSNTTNNVNVSMLTWGNNFGGGNTVAANPFSTKDTLVPLFWCRRPGTGFIYPAGGKGFSTLFQAGSVARSNFDTGDVGGTKTRVYYGALWLPWDGSTPSL